MKRSLFIFILIFNVFQINSSAARAEEIQSNPLKEIGITFGTPAAGNLVFGYWSNNAFPWLVRISGMDYGSIRGAQLDLGWAFDRGGKFKQYLAMSAISTRIESNSTTNNLNAVGPTYGFNLSDFCLQAGLVYGSYKEFNAYGEQTKSYPVQAVFEIGYTYLWE